MRRNRATEDLAQNIRRFDLTDKTVLGNDVANGETIALRPQRGRAASNKRSSDPAALSRYAVLTTTTHDQDTLALSFQDQRRPAEVGRLLVAAQPKGAAELPGLPWDSSESGRT